MNDNTILSYGDDMASYDADAYFRLPHASQMVWVKGHAVKLKSATELSGRQGFVVAPFHASDHKPLMLIEPVCVEVHPLKQFSLPTAGELHDSSSYSQESFLDYSPTFQTYHEALLSGQFQKLVLASKVYRLRHTDDIVFRAFQAACQLYPRMFISLFFTKASGEWLTISPEPILQGDGHGNWSTSAVAGTMTLGADAPEGAEKLLTWSTKNRQEQCLVAHYVGQTLARLNIACKEQGPRSIRAGHLAHLCSDFSFQLDSAAINNKCTREGDVLAALHPTPAVCGLPKEDAEGFIQSHSMDSRSYYSGYAGPLNLPLPGDEQGQMMTRLYVSLRCMHATTMTLDLYAGGGLLPESDARQEWEERQEKLETMKRCLVAGRMLTR